MSIVNAKPVNPFLTPLVEIHSASQIDDRLTKAALAIARTELTAAIIASCKSAATEITNGTRDRSMPLKVAGIGSRQVIKFGNGEYSDAQLSNRSLSTIAKIATKARREPAFKAQLEAEVLTPICVELKDAGFVDPQLTLSAEVITANYCRTDGLVLTLGFSAV